MFHVYPIHFDLLINQHLIQDDEEQKSKFNIEENKKKGHTLDDSI